VVSLDVSRHDFFLGYFYTVVVVRGNQQKRVFGKVVNDVSHALVIADMSIFYRVPNWRFVVMFLSEFALLVHVGTPDEFDTQVVAKNFGSCDFMVDDLGHALEVALVPIHDDSSVTAVKFVCQLLAE